MRVALATCESLPDWEVDDAPLHRALTGRGVELARPVWSDAAVDWTAYDACLLRTTWDYQERRDEFLAWAERVDRSTRLYNALPVILWNTHKGYLRDLAEHGVPTAETVWLAAGSTVRVDDVVADRGWSRAFLKPAVGATARETVRFDATRDGLATAQAHVDRLLSTEDLLLQPYLADVETHGELSAVYLDGCFSHAVRKVPVPGDYRVQDDFGAHDEPAELAADDRALADRIMSLAGSELLRTDLLYGRVDFLRGDDAALVVTELELVEPSLFFRHDPSAAGRLADALLARIT